MARRDLSKATIEELVERYRASAAGHRQGIETSDAAVANRHADVVASIYRELRARGVAAQSALLPLMTDPNPGVRGWAGAHGLEFAPQEGEACLIALAKGNGTSAFSAEMTLQEWREGRLRFP